jgi:hypothetical protein
MKNKLKIEETDKYVVAVSNEKPSVGNQVIYEHDTSTINTTCEDYVPNEHDLVVVAYLPKTEDAERLNLPLLPEWPVKYDTKKAIQLAQTLVIVGGGVEGCKYSEDEVLEAASVKPKWFVPEIQKTISIALNLVELNETKLLDEFLIVTTFEGEQMLSGEYLFID